MPAIVVVEDDRVGLLADIAAMLGKARINIESVNVDVVANKAVVTLTLADVKNAKRLLETAGHHVEDDDSIVVKLSDKPGELARITELLSKAGINLDRVHTLSRDGKNTMLSMKTSDSKKAAVILKDYLVTAQ